MQKYVPIFGGLCYNLTMRKINIFLNIIILFSLIIFVSGCSKKSTPKFINIYVYKFFSLDYDRDDGLIDMLNYSGKYEDEKMLGVSSDSQL